MIIVDASAIVELLLETRAAARVAARVLAADESLHAPHLLDVEVMQALRRYSSAGDLDEPGGARAIANFLDLRIERHAHSVLLERVWELRSSVSAYDATYLALAEALEAPLVTRDARLSRSHGHRAVIELL